MILFVGGIVRIRKFVTGRLDTNCYLVTEGETSLLIDAEVGLDKLAKEITRLDAVLITHAHFDHIKNLEKIALKYNCKVYLHELAVDKLTDPSKNLSASFGFCKSLEFDIEKMALEILKGGETLNIGDIKDIKVFSTPGHTNCSLCFQIGENLFTGDTIFKNGVGRTDFKDGDFSSLLRSLRVLKELRYENIYPGHGDSGKKLPNKNIKFY